MTGKPSESWRLPVYTSRSNYFSHSACAARTNADYDILDDLEHDIIVCISVGNGAHALLLLVVFAFMIAGIVHNPVVCMLVLFS
jgi:hypothetical protein